MTVAQSASPVRADIRPGSMFDCPEVHADGDADAFGRSRDEHGRYGCVCRKCVAWHVERYAEERAEDERLLRRAGGPSIFGWLSAEALAVHDWLRDHDYAPGCAAAIAAHYETEGTIRGCDLIDPCDYAGLGEMLEHLADPHPDPADWMTPAELAEYRDHMEERARREFDEWVRAIGEDRVPAEDDGWDPEPCDGLLLAELG